MSLLQPTEIIKIIFSDNGSISITLHWLIEIIAIMTVLVVIYLKFFGKHSGRSRGSLDISQISLGIGGHQVTLTPNFKDRQIAHKLWVELNTRKIGIEIDLENDVVLELYNSWYSFFQITRDLIKEIPVEKMRFRKNEIEFVDLAIEVLNKGLRPHLTRWQAKFRRWYELEINQADQMLRLLSPQQIQQRFPEYEELLADIIKVNDRLIYYKTQLKKISRNE